MKTKLTILILALSLFSCDMTFEELQYTQNRPTSTPPSIILKGILSDMNEIDPWDEEHRLNQYYCKINSYYGEQNYAWGSDNFSFDVLKNINKMEEEAIAAGNPAVNPYSTLAKFLKAWFYNDMLMKFGDIPMSEALKGTDNLTPAYDTQKQGFESVLTLLKEANTEFASFDVTQELEGDFYFNNDMSKWQKACNTLQLRILMHLSKRAEDTADLKIKERFATIINNPEVYPILKDAEDNLQYRYNNINKYPKTASSIGWSTRDVMADTYVSMLSQLRDPRIKVVSSPAKGLNNVDTYQNYAGAPSGMSQSEMEANTVLGLYSRVSIERYYASDEGEPNILLGYIDMCFNIAEAINRGWISGDAADYYNKAITESFAFYGIAGEVSEYLSNPDVHYKGDNAEGLKQILTQKYIAFFNQGGREAYYNYRRTGVPTFHIGPGTGNSERIALRFKYPESEQTFNTKQYNAALARQFNGRDDINDKMWIVK